MVNRRMKFLAVPMVLVLVASLLLAIPVFGASVTPIHIEDTGNFTCQQLADQYSPGSIWFELKFDPNPISVDPTIPDTLSTPLGSVTVLNGTELGFDWSSTFGIDAVFVKNGRDGHNLYIYDSAGDPNTESFGDSGLMPPGNNAISHISFCYDYELIASKTANATWYKTIDWTLTKDVTPASASAFIGGSANFDYTVTLTKNETFGPYVVEGKIYVTNPAPSPVSFSVADSAGGTAATVSCPTYTLAAGASTECTYSVSLAGPSNGTNTATITSNTADVGGTTATADYAFGEPILSEGSEPEEISVTDTLAGDLGSFSASGTAEYRLTQDCSDDPDDYAGDGIWSQDYPNTASINETTGDSDSESVTLTCYAPVITKDATATWYRDVDWSLEKAVTPASATAFIGGSAHFDYVVTLTKWESDEFDVLGSIYVANPAGSPGNMTVAVADMLDGSTAATVDCGSGATSITVAPGSSGTCSYTGDLAAKADGTNTATGTFNTYNFVATAPYAFGAPSYLEGSEPEEISVTDTLAGPLGSFSASGAASYTLTQDCSDDPDDYAGDGIWSQDYPNTASINETTGDSDSESVTLTCYAPVITKDAAASYDERHIWDVEKTVDPESQGGFPGDELPWTWTVTVSETFVEEDFAVSGTIYVANPAGSPGNITVSLVDKLNDGTLATVDCGGGATSVTVAPGASATCAYTAAPSGRTATLNKATGTFNRIDFVATYPVSFTKNVVNGTATVTDTEIGLNDDLTAGAGPWESTKDYSHTCSTDRADYFVDGVYTQIAETITNWAYVYSDGEEQDKDDAETTYTCDASFVDIYKTTNGAPADPTKDIRFALYSGTTLLSTVSTLNQGSALAFATALVPGDVYTICEYPVPAGYTFEISVNGGNVLTYAGPPGETNPTGEIQCFDFTAQSSGTTVTYDVNNRYPGGAPRTPGYWKNWNRCTGGNQAATADKLNDYLGPIDGAGVFLLNDLLPQTLGSWTVETCQVGVYILDSRDTSGKNMASDAAYTLAKALLAARLNQDAGACVPMDLTTMFPGETRTFEEVLTAADALLSSIKFNGTGSYLGPQVKKDLLTKRNTALYLYGIIDAYNNSKLCTGEPSH